MNVSRRTASSAMACFDSSLHPASLSFPSVFIDGIWLMEISQGSRRGTLSIGFRIGKHTVAPLYRQHIWYAKKRCL